MAKLKEGFKGERFLSLPDDLLESYSSEPLIAPLYIRKIGYFPRVKFHYVSKDKGSPYFMLIYCVDGKGWIQTRGKEQVVEKNQFLILPSRQPYSFGANNKDPWTIYFIHFQGMQAEAYYQRARGVHNITPTDDSRIQERLRLFEEMYRSYSMAYSPEYMIYSSIALSMFLASFVFLEQFRHLQSSSQKEIPFVSRVIHYMQEHLESNLTLNELASHFRYSSSHFSMLFQNETGVSPMHYFTRLKIQKACQYIELTNLKLNEISVKLGYEEPAYFSRIFSRSIGVSPSEYRAQKKDLSINESR
ncbi:AraC family transcriptional regulator [Porphyromonadaceae bacterium]